jgi:hypothetical protein
MIQNLIKKEDKENLRAGYRMRMYVTLGWCVFSASVISSVLFVPPYITAFYRVDSISDRNTSALVSFDKQKEILESVKTINKKADLALSLKNSLDIVQRITILNGEISDLVYIESIIYGKRDTPVIKLSGIARDREALIGFQKSIQGIDFVKNVSVPVSDFAKDIDLPFSMEIMTIN